MIYAVSHANAFEPAAAWYFWYYLCFVFALAERKNETQEKRERALASPSTIQHAQALGKCLQALKVVNRQKIIDIR